MADMIQFDNTNRSPICLACEEMLPDFLDQDAVDQLLSPADQSWFENHIHTCASCARMLADAQRGAAWLEILKSPRPEPSAQLLHRILAQTSGLEQTPQSVPHYGDPWVRPQLQPAPKSNLLRFPAWLTVQSSHFQPRLAMTAAMAFFSIALTLNLAGVRLDQLHARDLNPNRVKQTYYEASADAVRYYDNLRVVRDVESRVNDLRDASANKPDSQPESKPDKPAEKSTEKPTGSSQIHTPFARPRFQPVDDKLKLSPTKSPNKGGLA
jgi:hypothetical protein